MNNELLKTAGKEKQKRKKQEKKEKSEKPGKIGVVRKRKLFE